MNGNDRSGHFVPMNGNDRSGHFVPMNIDKGLIGFDSGIAGRERDPSCSGSLNGATKRSADGDFALAA
jgi:hypothetical protein